MTTSRSGRLTSQPLTATAVDTESASVSEPNVGAAASRHLASWPARQDSSAFVDLLKVANHGRGSNNLSGAVSLRETAPQALKKVRASWKVEMHELPASLAETSAGAQRLAEVDDLFARLAAIDPQLRAVVELRVFECLSIEECSERLGCSVSTVTRNWRYAKLSLQSQLASLTAEKITLVLGCRNSRTANRTANVIGTPTIREGPVHAFFRKLVLLSWSRTHRSPTSAPS
jgi:DNA-directed RNA polymerase specialized sigma24 family protein